MSKIAKPIVRIVVPTIGRIEDLKNCLGSLKRQTYRHFEIIVVNDSNNRGVRIIARRFDAKYRETRGFEGTATAINKGAEGFKGEILATTDDDCIYDKNWLKILVENLNKSEIIGVVGGKIINLGPKPVTVSSRMYKSFLLITNIFTSSRKKEKIGGIILENGHVDNFLNRNGYCYVDWVSGGSLAVKKSLFEKAKGLDENFKGAGYYTEPDFCFSIQKLGFKIFYTSRAKCWHKYSQVGGGSTKTSYLHTEHQTYYALKNFLLKSPRSFFLVTIQNLWELLFYAAKSIFVASALANFKGKIKGFIIYFSSQFS